MTRAQVNNLRPPIMPTDVSRVVYTDDAPPSGVLIVGRTIQIPDVKSAAPSVGGAANLPSASYRTNPAVLGASPGSPADEQLYGRDIAWRKEGDQLDFELHSYGELPDSAVQAVAIRIMTELGSAALDPNLGLGGMVGTGIGSINLQSLQLRVTQAVAADPRVASVQSVQVTYPFNTGDAVRIDAYVVRVGASETQRVTMSAYFLRGQPSVAVMTRCGSFMGSA